MRISHTPQDEPQNQVLTVFQAIAQILQQAPTEKNRKEALRIERLVLESSKNRPKRFKHVAVRQQPIKSTVKST